MRDRMIVRWQKKNTFSRIRSDHVDTFHHDHDHDHDAYDHDHDHDDDVDDSYHCHHDNNWASMLLRPFAYEIHMGSMNSILINAACFWDVTQ